MPTTKKTNAGSKKTGTKKSLLAAARAASERQRSDVNPPPTAGADIYTPPLDVLIALGSLAVHVEELIEVVGGFDKFEEALQRFTPIRFTNAVTADVAAMRTNLQTGNLPAWRVKMGALLPLKRSQR